MKRKTKVILIIIVLFIAVPCGFSAVRKAMTPAVGIVEVRGPIEEATEYLDMMKQFEEDDMVKAVIVHLDSPGGKVGPSQEMYDAVNRLRKTKPVIASMASVGASGAYYIACGADTIYALPGTLTGSIGVIMEFVDVSEGMQKVGISSNTITGGELKAAGTPFRRMTVKERVYFQELARDVHEQFKEAVSKGRKIEKSKLDQYADGRVFSGRQALAVGLVDRMGGIDMAVEDAAKRGRIDGKPRIIRLEPGQDVMDEVKRLIKGCAPVSLMKDATRMTRGFFRLEYSIQ